MKYLTHRIPADIYIIEDNHNIGNVLSFFLEGEGYKVSLFPSVELFHNAFSKAIPDLFLIDIVLPDGNGISVCNFIKQDFRTLKVPVILMSAQTPEEVLSKGLCADGFIRKPFALSILVDKIGKLLLADRN